MNKFQISNGKTISKPFNRIWFVLAILFVLTIVFWQFITYESSMIDLSQLFIIVKQMFTPKNTNLTQRTWADYFAFMLELRHPL